jgi:hypothetical protein
VEPMEPRWNPREDVCSGSPTGSFRRGCGNARSVSEDWKTGAFGSTMRYLSRPVRAEQDFQSPRVGLMRHSRESDATPRRITRERSAPAIPAETSSTESAEFDGESGRSPVRQTSNSSVCSLTQAGTLVRALGDRHMLVRMSADPAHRRQLGELLVEKGVVTDAQLQLALAEQEASGAPLGEILVRLGFTRGATIGNALAQQHGGPLRTEYGLALGPTHGFGMPSEQTLQFNNSGLAGDSAMVGRLPVADQTREQDDVIASLNAALDERTQELERVRIELAARDQHRAELATARADLEALRIELAKAREERSHAQELEIVLEQHKAELARARQERVEHDKLVHELNQKLEQARGQQDETAEREQAQHELRLVLQQQEAEFATVKAELARARQERVEHDKLVHELNQKLEQARGQQDETAESEQARHELQLALQQQEAELATVKAELARAQQELAQHDKLVHQLKQELEQARGQQDETAESQQARHELQLALQQQEAELATVKAELARATQELARQAEEARAADGFTLSKARHQAEPTQAPGEQAPRASLAKELEQRLALAQIETDDDLARAGQHSLRDLELTMKHHKAELEAIAAELSRALDERTEHANRAHDLEEQLERALTQNDGTAVAEHAQHDLVTAARARAQRRYGPPLRTAIAQEAGHEDNGHRRPLRAEPHIDTTNVNQASAITIPLWQLALFIVLVPFALYVLIPISGPLAAAVVVLLGAITVIHRRLTSRAR